MISLKTPQCWAETCAVGRAGGRAEEMAETGQHRCQGGTGMIGRRVLTEVRLQGRLCPGEAWRLQIGGLLAVFERATEAVLGKKFIVGRLRKEWMMKC